MPAANTVGVYVRDAGVWKRARPYVKVSGVWKECNEVYVKDGGSWETVWVDAANEINVGDATSQAINFNDTADAGWRMLANGAIEKLSTPGIYGTWTDVGQWRAYDVGRTFEAKFVRVSGTFTTTPTEDAYATIAGTLTLQNTTSGAAYLAGVEDVSVREVTTGDGLTTGRITVTAEEVPL